MNVNIIRLGPVQRELAGIRKALERMAAAKEMEMAHQGLHMQPPKADTSGADPDVVYPDLELEALREELEQSGKMTPALERIFDQAYSEEFRTEATEE